MEDDLSDLIDLYVRDALKATGTREGDRRDVVAAPIEVVEREVSAGFAVEIETATDADSGAAIEEMHVALMVAQQPELPRVLFTKPTRPPPVDPDDEITNVRHRFG